MDGFENPRSGVGYMKPWFVEIGKFFISSGCMISKQQDSGKNQAFTIIYFACLVSTSCRFVDDLGIPRALHQSTWRKFGHL